VVLTRAQKIRGLTAFFLQDFRFVQKRPPFSGIIFRRRLSCSGPYPPNREAFAVSPRPRSITNNFFTMSPKDDVPTEPTEVVTKPAKSTKLSNADIIPDAGKVFLGTCFFVIDVTA
jgi:hypothetical protein